MKDRLPKHPGRVKLIPVAGEENTFDLVRADKPTEEGTPLSKKNLLADVTAALFGMDEEATPNDVFAWLAEYVSAAPKTEAGSYIGTGASGSGNQNVLQFEFPPKLVVVSTNGVYPSRAALGIIHAIDENGLYFDNKNMPEPLSVSLDGNRIAWYDSAALYQMNESGVTYNYIAFK